MEDAYSAHSSWCGFIDSLGDGAVSDDSREGSLSARGELSGAAQCVTAAAGREDYRRRDDTFGEVILLGSAIVSSHEIHTTTRS